MHMKYIVAEDGNIVAFSSGKVYQDGLNLCFNPTGKFEVVKLACMACEYDAKEVLVEFVKAMKESDLIDMMELKRKVVYSAYQE